MKIAVLMTCHNRVRTTINCLRRLSAAIVECDESVDVWLVDDGSTDGTGDQAKALFPDVHVIRGNGKLYWSRGMHLAWETAAECRKYDFYLWLNDDVMLKSGALKMILDDWRKCGDERGVIIGACSADDTESSTSYSASDLKDRQLFPNGATPQRADGWFNGNFVLVPKRAFESVGTISDEYWHYRGDCDYAERLKIARIPFFCSSKFVGVCEKDYLGKVGGRGLRERLRMLVVPGGWNLHDLYLIRRKYHGVLRALLSCGHMIFLALKGV